MSDSRSADVGSTGAPDRAGADEPTRTVVVWCADWPAVSVGRPPERPVVVMEANRVVATNPAARAAGVCEGMRRREAQRVAPRAELHDRDPEREARIWEPVVAALDTVTPRIEITHPGTCLFPARGASRYFGGDRPLAERLARTVRGCLETPTAVGVGIADGVFAATLAARASAERDAAARSGDAEVPVIVPVGTSPRFLAPFPVDVLADTELVDVLVRLGIHTLGALASLPHRDVLARFGVAGRDAHRLANGFDLRPPHLEEPPPDLEVVHHPDPPLERVDQAAFLAKSLADELHERLEGRGLAAVAILIEATTERGTVIERRWRHEGALSSAAVAQRVRWQLDGWLTATRGRDPGAGALVSLRVRPTEVVPHSGRQLGFWGGADAAAVRARAGLARVQGLLGAEAVRVAEWRGGRAPGEQYRLVGIDTVATAPDESFDLAPPGDEPWPGRLPDPPPALVWPHPRSAEVVDAGGEPVRIDRRGRRSGDPARLSVESGPWRAVTGWSGPWLTEERWWDAIAHRRRARFQVTTDDGAAHLVTLEAHRWWVEATYD